MTVNATGALQIDMTGASETMQFKAGSNSLSAALAGDTPAEYAGRLCCGPIQMGYGSTTARVRLRAEFPTGSTGVIRIGNPCFRVLEGPLG